MEEWRAMNLDDEAEEALLTLAAATGLDAEEVINSAIIGYATIMQGREGMTCEIYRREAGKNSRVMRLLVIGDLYEDEMLLHSILVSCACAAIVGTGAFLLADSLQNESWFDVGMAALAVIAAAGLAYDTWRSTLSRVRVTR